MAGSQQLSEQRFVSEAMSRTHGDVPAAARLLGIGVDELEQCLERAGTLRPDAPKPSR
jgi:DNA-binding NtrC family response regulator